MVMQLGQMHIATAFVMPDALDNVEEEWGGEERVQPTDRQVKSCLPHPVTAVGLRCVPVIRHTWMWTRATGRTTPPCGSSTAGGCGTKSSSAGREPASIRR
ncbi:uncharacterized protein LOC144083064 isoform X3 [Stigmatopora argus]